MKWHALLLILFVSISSFAKYNLPTNLDEHSQEIVARNFGFGTAAKMNGDPLPLGGYDGFQISLSRDYVDVSPLKGLSTDADQERYFTSSRITVGKGLFYDVDVFFQMTSPGILRLDNSNDFTNYGAIARKVFYDNEKLPFHVGALIHASISQYANSFGSNIYGIDLYAYTHFDKTAFFLGLGQARGIFTYVGKNPANSSGTSLINSTTDSKIDLMSGHTWAGLSHTWGHWVLSATAEDYFDPMYSVVISYNF